MFIDLLQDLHTSTKRNYFERMLNDKPRCMEVASRYDHEYWDGERKYGYGGHIYDGRWKTVAQKIVDRYRLNSKSKVLDIGCGKGFLGYDIEQLTGCKVEGCDISDYALYYCLLEKKFKCDIGKDRLRDNYDLILCVNTLHNLQLPELKHALQEIDKHSKKAYICMDSFRNMQELFNLQCWALTCQQFHTRQEWEFLFKEWGYKGDYEFIYFE